MKENRTAHGVIDPNKTGPRPKELVEKTVLGIAVGRDKTVVTKFTNLLP
jgi:hypothetical protein